MRVYHWLGLAILSLVLAQAIAASSAGAEEPVAGVWLVNGSEVKSPLPAEISGELILENTSSGTVIACSVKWDTTLETKGEEKTNALLSLSGAETGETAATSLLCSSSKGCETGTDIEVWELKIGFLTWLYEYYILDPEIAEYLEFLFSTYHTACLVLGIRVEEECSGVEHSGIKAKNVTAGVELSGELTPLGKCGSGKENFKIKMAGMLNTTSEGTWAGSE
jgi:hypothetical protein